MNSKENNKLTAAELEQLRAADFLHKPGFVDAESVLSHEVGAKGTPERAAFDAKAQAWFRDEVLHRDLNPV